MKKIIGVIVLLFHLGMVNLSTAQTEPHFSQYYAYPLWLNPGLTGVIDGDVRINGNLKDQWSSVNDAYKTGALSFDLRLGEKMAFGGNIINQMSGGGYKYFAAYGSFAYEIPVSNSGAQLLNFGLQSGIINQHFDPGKLQFGSQYDPATGYDPGLPSNETFLSSNSTIFDVNAGVFYHDTDPLKAVSAFGGFSIAHITHSNSSFEPGGTTNQLPVRYNIHGGVRIRASDVLDIIPHGLYIGQQKNKIQALGISTEIKNANGSGLVMGGMYRINDAAVANLGYHLNTLAIGVSYDFNISGFKNASNGRGGTELSLSYIISKNRHGRPVCPRF